jgi:hypothetical protein
MMTMHCAVAQEEGQLLVVAFHISSDIRATGADQTARRGPGSTKESSPEHTGGDVDVVDADLIDQDDEEWPTEDDNHSDVGGCEARGRRE